MDGVIKEGSLGAILFKSQIISEQDIVAALKEQQVSRCRFGEALVRLGIVTQEDIDWALANQLNIPYIRLKKEFIDRGATALVSAELARQFNLLPIVRIGDELSVALADPLNRAAIEAVERATGLHVAVSIALMRELREMQDYFYGPLLDLQTLGFVSDAFTDEVRESINSDLSGGKLIDYLLPRYEREGKSHLTIAVGCTGGRHRSVAVARALHDHIAARRPQVDIIHREAERMAEIVKKIGKITRYETKAYVGSAKIVDLDKAAAHEE